MSLLRIIASGLRALFRKERLERETDEELREYLKMAIDNKTNAGMSSEQAQRTVRLETGGLETIKEEVRNAGWESSWRQSGVICDLVHECSGGIPDSLLSPS